MALATSMALAAPKVMVQATVLGSALALVRNTFSPLAAPKALAAPKVAPKALAAPKVAPKALATSMALATPMAQLTAPDSVMASVRDSLVVD